MSHSLESLNASFAAANRALEMIYSAHNLSTATADGRRLTLDLDEKGAYLAWPIAAAKQGIPRAPLLPIFEVADKKDLQIEDLSHDMRKIRIPHFDHFCEKLEQTKILRAQEILQASSIYNDNTSPILASHLRIVADTDSPSGYSIRRPDYISRGTLAEVLNVPNKEAVICHDTKKTVMDDVGTAHAISHIHIDNFREFMDTLCTMNGHPMIDSLTQAMRSSPAESRSWQRAVSTNEPTKGRRMS